MCGIVVANNEYEQSLFYKATQSLLHRGPDNNSTWTNEYIKLGHTRLAIIDLSPNSNQPLTSQSGRYTITYNGEVYNYSTLADKYNLEKNECGSDTKVIVELIELLGIQEAVNQFIGMFAFCVWDNLEKCAYFVRDRFGVKPLYITWGQKGLISASDLKAIKILTGHCKINSIALNQYITYGYIPTPHTIYEDIYKLQAGIILKIHESELKVRPNWFTPDKCDSKNYVKYWDPIVSYKQSSNIQFTGNLTQAKDSLKELLRSAIGLRLIADVPVGVFLSGGIDSSLVSAIAQEISNQKINTFSIGFKDTKLNEARHAFNVAKYLGTNHTELYCDHENILDAFLKLPDIYSEPFADASQIPTYLVSFSARKHVKVALSGDGGDELFWGYRRHLAINNLWKVISSLPFPLRKCIHSFTKQLQFKYDSISKLNNLLVTDDIDKFCQYTYCNISDSVYLSEDLRSQIPYIKIPSEGANISIVERLVLHDLSLYLPDDILVKVDRASMYASLEAREPLLDQRLFEFSASLPKHFKIHSGKGKHVARELLFDYIPSSIVDRPKAGFTVPIEQWLKTTLKEVASDLLSYSNLSKNQIFDNSKVMNLWNSFLSDNPANVESLWRIIILQMWLSKEN